MKVDVGIDYITCHNCRCLVALVTWVTSCQNCGQVVVSRTASHG